MIVPFTRSLGLWNYFLLNYNIDMRRVHIVVEHDVYCTVTKETVWGNPEGWKSNRHAMVCSFTRKNYSISRIYILCGSIYKHIRTLSRNMLHHTDDLEIIIITFRTTLLLLRCRTVAKFRIRRIRISERARFSLTSVFRLSLWWLVSVRSFQWSSHCYNNIIRTRVFMLSK